MAIVGGHLSYFGIQATGPDECRAGVRQLVKEGADFIKIMGSGGGTYITDNRYASCAVEELRAIGDEAQRHNLICTVHVIASQSIANAIDAGVDSL